MKFTRRRLHRTQEIVSVLSLKRIACMCRLSGRLIVAGLSKLPFVPTAVTTYASRVVYLPVTTTLTRILDLTRPYNHPWRYTDRGLLIRYLILQALILQARKAARPVAMLQCRSSRATRSQAVGMGDAREGRDGARRDP
eukprot:717334-Pyramimonas_sp.AAC.3